jgi:hypothetical protein
MTLVAQERKNAPEKESRRGRNHDRPFRAADVNRAPKIHYAGVFLPKPRVGNPGIKGKNSTEQFVSIERGLYRLS